MGLSIDPTNQHTMSNEPTLSEVTLAYNVGRTDGEKIGHIRGILEERGRHNKRVTALAWICLIELGFIALILFH